MIIRKASNWNKRFNFLITREVHRMIKEAILIEFTHRDLVYSRGSEDETEEQLLNK